MVPPFEGGVLKAPAAGALVMPSRPSLVGAEAIWFGRIVHIAQPSDRAQRPRARGKSSRQPRSPSSTAIRGTLPRTGRTSSGPWTRRLTIASFDSFRAQLPGDITGAINLIVENSATADIDRATLHAQLAFLSWFHAQERNRNLQAPPLNGMSRPFWYWGATGDSSSRTYQHSTKQLGFEDRGLGVFDVYDPFLTAAFTDLSATTKDTYMGDTAITSSEEAICSFQAANPGARTGFVPSVYVDGLYAFKLHITLEVAQSKAEFLRPC